MSRLTRERVEQLCYELDAHTTVPEEEVLALRDLALQSLSQEAVRDEVLEEAARVAELFTEPTILAFYDRPGGPPGNARVAVTGKAHIAPAIRALKREPNAAAQASGSSEHTVASANPAPAAPDVGSWLIWSNEHEAWWGHDRCGYPHDITKAGRYSFDEARAICRQRHWGDRRPPEVMICERDIPARSLR